MTTTFVGNWRKKPNIFVFKNDFELWKLYWSQLTFIFNLHSGLGKTFSNTIDTATVLVVLTAVSIFTDSSGGMTENRLFLLY